MSGLSDYVNSLNREGWSLRRISQEAEKHGHKIDHTTVRKYVNGTHGTPSGEALAALAAAFGVDVNALRRAARRPSVGEPLDLGPESGRLTGSQREAIRHVVRVMLEQNDALADPPVPDGAIPDTGGMKRWSEAREAVGTSLPAEHWKLAASKGPRRMEEADRRAAVAGEESQDPGHDEPA